MPEIPDLEAIKSFFNERILGLNIEDAEVRIPVVVRASKESFSMLLRSNAFGRLQRMGKFLIFPLNSGHALVINPMLTGRFDYTSVSERMPSKTCFTITMEAGLQIRYVDARLMGKVYLVEGDRMGDVPQLASLGPDALDPSLTEGIFLARLGRYRGQIKNVLVNQEFIAGIGNAYADEILFAAGIHPYRKRTALSTEAGAELYGAMHKVLDEAIETVRGRMLEELSEDKIRDFLKVHRKGGEPCPACAAPITEITANQRITSFCRHCQQ